MEPHEDIAKVLFSEEDIRTRVAEMGKELASLYETKQPLVLGVSIHLCVAFLQATEQFPHQCLKLPTSIGAFRLIRLHGRSVQTRSSFMHGNEQVFNILHLLHQLHAISLTLVCLRRLTQRLISMLHNNLLILFQSPSSNLMLKKI